MSNTNVFPPRGPTVVTSKTTGSIRVRLVPYTPHEVSRMWPRVIDTTGRP